MRKLLKASLLGGMVMLATTINPLTHAEEPVFTGVTYDTVNGTITITYDGKSITMQDRNVGASTEIPAAGGDTSTDLYGLYYQWGGTTGFEYNQSSGDAINLSGFATGTTVWAQATSGITDWGQGPCPSGYHVPTLEEWQQVIDMYTGAENEISAFYNAFKIPFASFRFYSAEMATSYIGTYAQLWSDSSNANEEKDSNNAKYLVVSSTILDNSHTINRASALPVRCFKDDSKDFIPLVELVREGDTDGIEYSDLKTALADAEEYDDIVLLDDVIIDQNIVISKNISLNIANGKTLTISENATLTMDEYAVLGIEEGGKLIVEGKLDLPNARMEVRGDFIIPDLIQNLNLSFSKFIGIFDKGTLKVSDELLIGGSDAIFNAGDSKFIMLKSENKSINFNFKLNGLATLTKDYTIPEGYKYYFNSQLNINDGILLTVDGYLETWPEKTSGKILATELGDVSGLKDALPIEGKVLLEVSNSNMLRMTLFNGTKFSILGTDYLKLPEGDGPFTNGFDLSDALGLNLYVIAEEGAIITIPAGQKLIYNADNLIAVKDGYTFDSWYIDEELSTPYNSSNVYDGETILYPKFTKIPDPTPTPSYSGGGGSRGRSVSKSEDNKKVDEDIVENKEENNEEVEENNNEENNTDKSELELAYEWAYKNGITTMDTMEKAELDQPLTRIAMAKMLSQYAMNVLGKVPANKMAPRFDDVTDELNDEYYGGSEIAYQLNIMGLNIPDNKFRPFDLVTRAEFGTALSRLLFGLSDGEGLYYETHLAKLKDEGIITNDTPDLEEARGYIILMLMRSAHK